MLKRASKIVVCTVLNYFIGCYHIVYTLKMYIACNGDLMNSSWFIRCNCWSSRHCYSSEYLWLKLSWNWQDKVEIGILFVCSDPTLRLHYSLFMGNATHFTVYGIISAAPMKFGISWSIVWFPYCDQYGLLSDPWHGILPTISNVILYLILYVWILYLDQYGPMFESFTQNQYGPLFEFFHLIQYGPLFESFTWISMGHCLNSFLESVWPILWILTWKNMNHSLKYLLGSVWAIGFCAHPQFSTPFKCFLHFN